MRLFQTIREDEYLKEFQMFRSDLSSTLAATFKACNFFEDTAETYASQTKRERERERERE